MGPATWGPAEWAGAGSVLTLLLNFVYRKWSREPSPKDALSQAIARLNKLEAEVELLRTAVDKWQTRYYELKADYAVLKDRYDRMTAKKGDAKP